MCAGPLSASEVKSRASASAKRAIAERNKAPPTLRSVNNRATYSHENKRLFLERITLIYDDSFTKSLGLTNADGMQSFELGGEVFARDLRIRHERALTSEDSFTIVKTNSHLNLYSYFRQFSPKSIFEVGYFEGGSSVFIDRLFSPEHLTCVDNRKTRVTEVDNYIDRQDRSPAMNVVHNFDQADADGLRELADRHHSDGLDIVFDDASHMYDQTKVTLSVLFPRLKPGGFYVIEDYGWVHSAAFQGADHPWAELSGVSTLVFELIGVLANNSTVIQDIYLDGGACVIRKGHAAITEPFEPLDRWAARGKSIPVL
jgi:predicted O-methyltransferase YrrM